MTVLPDLSLQGLLPEINQVVEGKVGSLKLDGHLTVDDILKLISDIQDNMEGRIGSWSWSFALGKETLHEVECRVVNSAMWHAHCQHDSKLVDGVINEARELVGSKRFAICLRDSVRCYTQCVAQHVPGIVEKQPNDQGDSNTRKPKSLPFAKCISLANRLSKAFLDKDVHKIQAVGTLGVVHDLCVDVYTSGVILR